MGRAASSACCHSRQAGCVSTKNKRQSKENINAFLQKAQGRTAMRNTGSGVNGCWARWHSTWEAAARPKIAGMVPKTGIVRTLKLGITCRHDMCSVAGSASRDSSGSALGQPVGRFQPGYP